MRIFEREQSLAFYHHLVFNYKYQVKIVQSPKFLPVVSAPGATILTLPPGERPAALTVVLEVPSEDKS